MTVGESFWEVMGTSGLRLSYVYVVLTLFTVFSGDNTSGGLKFWVDFQTDF